MKKILLTFTILLSLIGNKVSANNTDLFAMNEDQVSASLSQATEIENYVINHENTTLTFLQTESQSNLNLKNVVSNFRSFTFDSMDWQAFLWGFCCFPIGAAIGAFIILLDDNSSDDSKKSYLIGAAVGFVFSSGLWRASIYNGWFWY